MMPWKILESTQNYIFIWLTGYSALLGPIAGIMIIDYYFIRQTRLDVDQLYRDNGAYDYTGGWNIAAIVAFAAGVLPNLPGFLHAALPASFPNVDEAFKTIYTYAWFVGVVIAAIVYGLMMKGRTAPAPRAAPTYTN